MTKLNVTKERIDTLFEDLRALGRADAAWEAVTDAEYRDGEAAEQELRNIIRELQRRHEKLQEAIAVLVESGEAFREKLGLNDQ